jgi:ferredoxin-NADP reductase
VTEAAAGTATGHRLAWRAATLVAARPETATARTLVLDVPGWPGHRAGQHVIMRLTAADGYRAQRSYSIASPPGPPGGGRLEVTVQKLAGGEVSPYLADVMEPGDQVEVRGPIGGWFAWDPGSAAPLQLIAGGSGIVPLMAMIRAAQGAVPVRLLYSARTPADVIYAAELARRARDASLRVACLFTRVRDAGTARTREPAWREAPGSGRHHRVDASVIAAETWPPAARPAIFACGPAGFVAAASGLLVAAGHAPATIRTERFGPTSERN